MRETKLECTYQTSLPHFVHLIFFNESVFLNEFLSTRGLKHYSVSEITTGRQKLIYMYDSSNHIIKPSPSNGQYFSRTIQLSSEINAPRVLNISEGEVLIHDDLIWHSPTHFTSEFTITIVTEIPFKNNFSFHIAWDLNQIDDDSTSMVIDIKCGFNKSLMGAGNLIEGAMEKYLVSQCNKWIKLANAYVGNDLESIEVMAYPEPSPTAMNAILSVNLEPNSNSLKPSKSRRKTFKSLFSFKRRNRKLSLPTPLPTGIIGQKSARRFTTMKNWKFNSSQEEQQYIHEILSVKEKIEKIEQVRVPIESKESIAPPPKQKETEKAKLIVEDKKLRPQTELKAKIRCCWFF